MMLESEIIKMWHEEWYERLFNPEARCIWGNRWQHREQNPLSKFKKGFIVS